MFANLRTTNVLLAVIATILVFAVLKLTQVVLIPIVIACFFVAMIQPIVTGCSRFVPRAAIIPVILLLFAGFMLTDALFFFASIKNVAAKAPLYAERFQRIAEQAIVLANKYGLHLEPSELQTKKLFEWLLSFMTSGISSIVALLGQTTLVFFIMLFLIAEVPHFQRKFDVGFGKKTSAEMQKTFQTISIQIQRYALTKTLISLLTGLSTYFVTYFLGIDFPIFWGMLAFLLNFIPNLGSIIAVFPPVLIAFLQYNDPWKAGILLGILTVIQTFFGYLLEPRVMGNSLSLSSLVVIFSLLVWGWLWGAVGLILSVPLTVAVKVTCEHIPPLRPIAVLLGPAPPPDKAPPPANPKKRSRD